MRIAWKRGKHCNLLPNLLPFRRLVSDECVPTYIVLVVERDEAQFQPIYL
jgi:hypothetical protein